MEKEQRNRLQKATQDARKLLEEEFRSQLLQTYDIDVEKVRWAEDPGAHLQAEQRLIREKLVAWIEHKEAQINDRKEALLLALREMAFTALNRFVALKLMEARELVRPCVSGGLESAGFLEFTAVAQGLLADQESSYRLYLETIFEDVSRELRALFDPRDPASLLWPKRAALLELLDILNRPELAELWSEDETLGWVYQYFNGDAERKKMREESAAPRNSRELAVRNQFFTPRYVVEFLTDNTLGRIWYEMRQGNTGLKDQCRYLVRRPNEVWLQPGEEPPAQPDPDETLSQEELLRQPVYIPHRPLKDPREIRMLDPACGSMHFGLYAFDLYLEIYKEAWEIARGSDIGIKQGGAFATFVSYAENFPDLASFIREAPRLILEYNIHGIDIDQRATHIAKLALWMRAQRAWLGLEIETNYRPQISRSNIATAEPMPGEEEILCAFVDNQFALEEQNVFNFLLHRIFQQMQLAGEAGSLLEIEQEIRCAISEAIRLWKAGPQYEQPTLFGEYIDSSGRKRVGRDFSSISSNDFWNGIEELIYKSLSSFASFADDSTGFRRNLFTQDAVRGFAFIDLLNRSYDVVLMNPPFGTPTPLCEESQTGEISLSGNNLFSSFVKRGIQLLETDGFLGAITPRTGFFLSSFQDWREKDVLRQSQIIAFADLGLGVMDGAFVEAAAYCLSRCQVSSDVSTIFLRVLEEEDCKEDALLAQVSSSSKGSYSAHVFTCNCKEFSTIQGSPFAYWINHEVRSAFERLDATQSDGRYIKVGDHPGDSFRFLRFWWETPVSLESSSWTYYQKGGSFSPYYAELPFVVDWDHARNSYRGFLGRAGRSSDKPSNYEFFFRPGITWSRRTNKFISMRVFPSGCIFSDKGPVAFVDGDNEESLLALLALTNSKAYSALLDVQLAVGDSKIGGLAKSYEVGLLQRTPFPEITKEDEARLSQLAYESWRIHQSRDYTNETSILFVAPLLNLSRDMPFNDAVNCYEQECLMNIKRAKAIQAEIDDLSFNLYGISAIEIPALDGSSNSTVLESSPNNLSVTQELDEAGVDASSPLGLWSRNIGMANIAKESLDNTGWASA